MQKISYYDMGVTVTIPGMSHSKCKQLYDKGSMKTDYTFVKLLFESENLNSNNRKNVKESSWKNDDFNDENGWLVGALDVPYIYIYIYQYKSIISLWLFQSIHEARFTSLKRKCHFDDIFITGHTASCQNDSFQCSQWYKISSNWRHNRFRVIVIKMLSFGWGK